MVIKKMKIPSEFTAGDSLSWFEDPGLDNLGNTISAPDWTLKFDFKQGNIALSLTGTASGNGWALSLSAIQSKLFVDGVLFWQAYATKGLERVTIGSGRVNVLKNLADFKGTFDGRSQAERDLAMVNEAIRSMIAGGAVSEYTIRGRSLKKISMVDLMAIQSQLKAEVFRERKKEMMKNGLGNPQSVYVRFKA